MSPEIAALIAASIAAVASLVSLYVNSQLTISRERRQQLWQYDLEQVRGVEQLAGRMAELLGGYSSLEQIEALLPDLIGQFTNRMGHFRRYRQLNQAMRDFHNAANRVLDTLRHGEDPRPDKEDLSAAFDKLARACDEVLKRQGVYHTP